MDAPLLGEADGLITRFELLFAGVNSLKICGKLAEQEGHHPAILTEWGRVTVCWWTHKIRGLHRSIW